jgi:ribose transport system substrate-binding protein
MKTAYTIGFSSLAESMPSVAYRTQTLIEAANKQPGLTLIVRDNDLNDEKALANAQEFASLPVDLAIIFHINERLGNELRQILAPKGIPIIAVDVPIPLAYYFGANNQQAGELVGKAMGKWIQTHWGGQIDKMLVMTDSRVVSVVRQRVDSAIDAVLQAIPYQRDDVFYLDSGSTRDIAAERALDVLQRWDQHRHIAVIGVNDDTALGVYDAACQLNRTNDVVIVGQGADALVREHFRQPNPRIIASTDYRLDQYGPRLIDLSLRILQGERVPSKNYIDHICVTPG